MAQTKQRDREALYELLSRINYKKVTPKDEVIGAVYGRYTYLSDLLINSYRADLIRALLLDEHTSCMLNLIGMTREFGGHRSMRKRALKTFGAAAEYAIYLFDFQTIEISALIFTDEKMNVLTTCTLHSDSQDSCRLTLHDIVMRKPRKERCGVIIAHNHCNAPCIPSEGDACVAHYLKNALPDYGIRLQDSLIVGKDCAYSMEYDKKFVLPKHKRLYPDSNDIDC